MLYSKVSAQENAWVKFGNCQFNTCEDWGKAGAECCSFTDNTIMNTYFCMTEEQKGGEWKGTYTDDENTQWEWTCAKPPDTDKKDDGKKDDDMMDYKKIDFSMKGHREHFELEVMLWNTYMAGNFYLVGWPY